MNVTLIRGVSVEMTAGAAALIDSLDEVPFYKRPSWSFFSGLDSRYAYVGEVIRELNNYETGVNIPYPDLTQPVSEDLFDSLIEDGFLVIEPGYFMVKSNG